LLERLGMRAEASQAMQVAKACEAKVQ
jgi:hypothetical protein